MAGTPGASPWPSLGGSGAPLRTLIRRRRERLSLLDDVGGDHFRSLLARTCVMDRAGRYLVGIPRFEWQWGLALDQKREVALQHVARLGAGVGVTNDVHVRGDLGDADDRFVIGPGHVKLL